MSISIMIFTLDEEVHLPSCLDSLTWCDDVIVVDSFSADGTERICRERGVRFVQRAFDGFGTQRNWALDNVPTEYPWVLILDADERVPDALAREMRQKVRSVPADVSAFRLRRRFHMWGRWLRYSSLYPSWVVRLVRKDRVRYVDRGHGETQAVDGRIEQLEHDLIDENLKGIDEWFERQNRYSRKDADFELNQPPPRRPLVGLVSRDPLYRRAAVKYAAARLPGRGVLYFVYVYVLRGGILDGRDGLVFSLMRASYQTMIAVKKYDARRRAGAGRASSAGDPCARPAQSTAPAVPCSPPEIVRKSATS